MDEDRLDGVFVVESLRTLIGFKVKAYALVLLCPSEHIVWLQTLRNNIEQQSLNNLE
jgi:hypothetical protein